MQRNKKYPKNITSHDFNFCSIGRTV